MAHETHYDLYHLNTRCAVLSIDDDDCSLNQVVITDKEYAPFLGKADEKMMKKWWTMRAIPASRKAMQDVIRKAGCETNIEYLAKNLAISLTDTYWICPQEINLSWKDINPLNMLSYNKGKMPYHNFTSYDPNATLGGQMEKYWDLNGKTPILVKESYKYYGQQAANEGFATLLHEKQSSSIPYVKYVVEKQDNGLISKCSAFTNENIEFVSAYEIISTASKENDKNNYKKYIETCAKLGVDKEEIQKFMDYQTMTDFLISNLDEHLLNFGVLRDTNTMRIISPAPIFDNGNSMFYNTKKKYFRHEILGFEYSGFYSSEEKMLTNVKNKDLVDIEKLPSTDEIIDFYTKAGIPEAQANNIAYNFSVKKALLNEFQNGHKISRYFEKQSYNKLHKISVDEFDFSPEQYSQIRQGLDNGIDIEKYADPKLSIKKMQAIRTNEEVKLADSLSETVKIIKSTTQNNNIGPSNPQSQQKRDHPKHIMH